MSNSNFNITKVVVDPISQEISSLEVNGKPIETGGEVNLEQVTLSPLNVSDLFIGKPAPVEIHPSEGYDGIKQVTIDSLTGYPGEGLEFINNPQADVSGLSSEKTITIPEGQAWTGTVTLIPGEEP